MSAASSLARLAAGTGLRMIGADPTSPPGGPPTPGMSAGLGWFVRAHMAGYLDARETRLSDRGFRVFLLLDCRAGQDCYCFPGNSWICERAGKSPRAIQLILDELEQDGWIKRIFTDATRKDRIGFLLLRRVDPASIAADTPERLVQGETDLRARVGGEEPPPGGPMSARNCAHGAQDSSLNERKELRSVERKELRPYLESVLKETDSKAAAAEPPSRQDRQEQPEPDPEALRATIQVAREVFPQGGRQLETRAKNLVRDFGVAVALEAFERAKSRIIHTGERVTFKYVIAAANGIAADGGSVGVSATTADLLAAIQATVPEPRFHDFDLEDLERAKREKGVRERAAADRLARLARPMVVNPGSNPRMEVTTR